MQIFASFVLLLFSMSAFAQKKSSIKISEAKLISDTLTLKYSIKNISPSAFTYYVPGATDFKYYLIGVTLTDVSKKKSYKYKVQPGGDLDKLSVDKSRCIDVLPGDSVSLTLSLGIDSFYIKKKVSNNLSVMISVFFEGGLVWCSDCKHKLLQENFSSERKVVVN